MIASFHLSAFLRDLSTVLLSVQCLKAVGLFILPAAQAPPPPCNPPTASQFLSVHSKRVSLLHLNFDLMHLLCLLHWKADSLQLVPPRPRPNEPELGTEVRFPREVPALTTDSRASHVSATAPTPLEGGPKCPGAGTLPGWAAPGDEGTKGHSLELAPWP